MESNPWIGAALAAMSLSTLSKPKRKSKVSKAFQTRTPTGFADSDGQGYWRDANGAWRRSDFPSGRVRMSKKDRLRGRQRHRQRRQEI